MTEDFYDLLDVPRDASQEEIRRAFRRQVRIYHPDLNDDRRAQAQFTALNKAYEILGDPVERRAYDRLGHEEYVAKRTSGLPSPERWARTDDDRSRATAAAGNSSSTAEERAWHRNTGSGGSTRSGRVGNANASATGTTSSGGSSGVRSDGIGARSRRSAGSTGRSHPFDRSRIVRWWHSRNFAWPLIWFGTLLYVAGLVGFARRNDAALRSLFEAVASAGLAPAGVWRALAGDSHGVETGFGHVTAIAVVEPPLSTPGWYALLGAVVATGVVALLVARVRWRDRTFEPVTIDETIVLAAVVGVPCVLLGGALLAGALLLPLFFGVVIYHTRRLPGWSPSWAYVVAVSAPAVAITAGWLGVTSLPFELVALVVCPLVGALGLPIRVAVRRRFGV